MTSEYNYTFPFLSSNLTSDYSTQQLSAVNDGPGGGVGTGIYLDHNQYSSSSSRGSKIGTDFGSNTVKIIPPGEKLDFSSPSLYTNKSDGGLGNNVCFLHIILALAISAVTSTLFSYSHFCSSSSSSRLWSHHNISKNEKFMQNNVVDVSCMKHETDHIHNIPYLKRYVGYRSCSGNGNQPTEGSMDCVLCI